MALSDILLESLLKKGSRQGAGHGIYGYVLNAVLEKIRLGIQSCASTYWRGWKKKKLSKVKHLISISECIGDISSNQQVIK